MVFSESAKIFHGDHAHRMYGKSAIIQLGLGRLASRTSWNEITRVGVSFMLLPRSEPSRVLLKFKRAHPSWLRAASFTNTKHC